MRRGDAPQAEAPKSSGMSLSRRDAGLASVASLSVLFAPLPHNLSHIPLLSHTLLPLHLQLLTVFSIPPPCLQSGMSQSGMSLSRRDAGLACVASLSVLFTPMAALAVDPTGASADYIFSLNKRIQVQNRAKPGFPGFIREGFNVLVVADGLTVTADGYTGYNESATPIDSSYNTGRPAQARIGVSGLIPGFEEGLKTMKLGTQRRIIVPPALGPPVGPSTFFSAKQCEVFDVEIVGIRTCTRSTVGMFSNVVCE
eukprot:gene28312-31423_t